MIIYFHENIKFGFVKPYYLVVNDEFVMRKGVVKNGTLQWMINGVLITYKKIKNKEYVRL